MRGGGGGRGRGEGGGGGRGMGVGGGWLSGLLCLVKEKRFLTKWVLHTHRLYSTSITFYREEKSTTFS